MVRKISAKLPTIAAVAAVLALSAACGGGDDGDDEKQALATWANQVCAAEVTGKIDASKAALDDISVVIPAESPEALKARLVADVTKLAEANTAFAAALGTAGDPKVKDADVQVLALGDELRATANGWNTVKTQLEALPTQDQKAFADGLRALEANIAGSVTSSRASLDKLHTGRLGQALAAVPGCVGSASAPPVSVSPSSVPSAPVPSVPAPGQSGSSGPSGSASPKSDASDSASPTSSSSASGSPAASGSASTRSASASSSPSET